MSNGSNQIHTAPDSGEVKSNLELDTGASVSGGIVDTAGQDTSERSSSFIKDYRDLRKRKEQPEPDNINGNDGIQTGVEETDSTRSASDVRAEHGFTDNVHTSDIDAAEFKERTKPDSNIHTEVSGLQTGDARDGHRIYTEEQPKQAGNVSSSYKEQGALKSRQDAYKKSHAKNKESTGKIETEAGVPASGGTSSGSGSATEQYKFTKGSVEPVPAAQTAANTGLQTGSSASGGTVETASKAGKTGAAGKAFGKVTVASRIAKARGVDGKAVEGLKMVRDKAIMKLLAPMLPYIAAAAGFILLAVVITAIIGAVMSFFGGMFTRSGEDVVAREVLLEDKAIPAHRETLAEEIYSANRFNSPDVHRIYYSGSTYNSSDYEIEDIFAFIPPAETIATHMEGPFMAELYIYHELSIDELHDDEAGETALDDRRDKTEYEIIERLFGQMFYHYTLVAYEYCGLSLTNGLGTIIICECNDALEVMVHARPDCPNPIEDNHSSYEHGSCCNRLPDGTFDGCDGYEYCGSHKITTTYVQYLGVGALINELFIKPMLKMEAEGNTETAEYRDLRDFLELTHILVEMLFDEHGDAMNGVRYLPDITMYEAVPSSRIGCEASVIFGKSFIKPESYGRPNIFTQYAGFSDEWCAMFTNYVHEKAPCGEHDHGAVQMRSWSTSMIMAMAKTSGQWADMNYMTPAPGDWILFNWRYDVLHSDYSPWQTGCGHVGVVTHVDKDGWVHYVHGNTGGDRVRADSRPLTDTRIRGYVVMFP